MALISSIFNYVFIKLLIIVYNTNISVFTNLFVSNENSFLDCAKIEYVYYNNLNLNILLFVFILINF